MKREIVTIKDFERISKENEYFLWSFLQRNQENSQVVFHSIYSEPVRDKKNLMVDVLKEINIPYFESFTDESIDFLINLGLPASNLWKTPIDYTRYVPLEYYFNPVILGFHKSSFKISTIETCYCMEGLIELIGKLNPKFLIDVKLD